MQSCLCTTTELNSKQPLLNNNGSTIQLVFSESDTPVVLLVPGFNTLYYGHWFKDIISTKTSPIIF